MVLWARDVFDENLRKDSTTEMVLRALRRHGPYWTANSAKQLWEKLTKREMTSCPGPGQWYSGDRKDRRRQIRSYSWQKWSRLW